MTAAARKIIGNADHDELIEIAEYLETMAKEVRQEAEACAQAKAFPPYEPPDPRAKWN